MPLNRGRRPHHLVEAHRPVLDLGSLQNPLHDQGPSLRIGQSVVAGPDGGPIARAGLEATLLIADIPEPGASGQRPLASTLEDLREIQATGDGRSSLPPQS